MDPSLVSNVSNGLQFRSRLKRVTRSKPSTTTTAAKCAKAMDNSLVNSNKQTIHLPKVSDVIANHVKQQNNYLPPHDLLISSDQISGTSTTTKGNPYVHGNVTIENIRKKIIVC